MEKKIKGFMDWVLSYWEQGQITDPQIIAAMINYAANHELAKAATPDTCEICGSSSEDYVRCTRCGRIIGEGHRRSKYHPESCYITLNISVGEYVVSKVVCVECIQGK